MNARIIFSILVVFLAGAQPANAEWRATIIPTDGKVIAVSGANSESLIETATGWYRPEATNGSIQLIRTTPPAPSTRPANALPDGTVARGNATIAKAWFSDPTRRYDHGVLGDAVEAGSLTIERADGERRTLSLGADAVFEDLVPRLADLNRNGEDEIVAVKSYLARGSALAVIGLRDGAPTILAETPAIGHPHAWLNPAGIADFNGDGDVDIALVRQPHVLGQLELWTWRHGRLDKIDSFPGVSNHFIGSRALAMAAVADFDGDTYPDLAIPARDRKALLFIGFRPKAHIIATIPLPARAATNIAIIDVEAAPAIMLGLDNGALALVSTKR